MIGSEKVEVLDGGNAGAMTRVDHGAIAHIPSAMPIENILHSAVERGADPATLEKLLGLYEKMKGMRAVEEFNAAFAAFKAECPPVERRTENNQFKVTRNGTQQIRRYASLEDIEATVRPVLGKHGLSYRWANSQMVGDSVTIDCVVSHSGGHSVTSPVSMKVTSSAGCSEQQKYGAALTYAQRYSLIMALGLTTCEEDTDGNVEGGGGAAHQPINPNQAANLQALIDDVGADKAKFLAVFGIKALSDLPAYRFQEAVEKLEAKRRQTGGGR